MKSFQLCKECGRIVDKELFIHHLIQYHQYGPPVYRGLNTGDKKSFHVNLRE